MKLKSPYLLNGYVFAVLAVVLICAFRLSLNPLLGNASALLTFIFPVIVTSLFFGLVPGILATFLGVLLGVYFYVPLEGKVDAFKILIFVIEGFAISALGEFHLRKKLKLLEVLRTISESKEKQQLAENDLAKVWRLNTLGEMASGLAHELSQPVSAIKNYSMAVQKFLETDKNSNPFIVESIKGIGLESERASKFIYSLRSFIGSRTPQKQEEDINKLITDIDLLIKSDLNSHKIKIKYLFSEPTLELKIDKIQIMQVILNLLRNSIESMTTQSEKSKEITVETKLENNGALIVVNDTGCGIPAEHSDKVYEAFYSTKTSGMGMGLAISRSMIEVHRGKIWNEPNEHMGTTFKVWLPLKDCHV